MTYEIITTVSEASCEQAKLDAALHVYEELLRYISKADSVSEAPREDAE